MQYSIALSALVAAALAQPHHGNHHQKHHQKRDIVLETEVQYVTKVVMVTDVVNGPSPTAASLETVQTSALPASSTAQILGQQYSGGSSTDSEAPSAAPVESPSTSAEPSNPIASGVSLTYEAIVLLHHNIHRANHSVSALTWSDELAGYAQQIASTCDYAHSRAVGNGDYGQNIAAGVPSTNISSVITDLFYNGEIGAFGDQYGNPDPVGFEDWGHFSQVVWSGTTSVGCYTSDCSAQGLQNAQGTAPYFTVCNYGPPGNVAGGYNTGILPPLGHPTAEWNYGL